jgi:hypothetical protein
MKVMYNGPLAYKTKYLHEDYMSGTQQAGKYSDQNPDNDDDLNVDFSAFDSIEVPANSSGHAAETDGLGPLNLLLRRFKKSGKEKKALLRPSSSSETNLGLGPLNTLRRSFKKSAVLEKTPRLSDSAAPSVNQMPMSAPKLPNSTPAANSHAQSSAPAASFLDYSRSPNIHDMPIQAPSPIAASQKTGNIRRASTIGPGKYIVPKRGGGKHVIDDRDATYDEEKNVVAAAAPLVSTIPTSSSSSATTKEIKMRVWRHKERTGKNSGGYVGFKKIQYKTKDVFLAKLDTSSTTTDGVMKPIAMSLGMFNSALEAAVARELAAICVSLHNKMPTRRNERNFYYDQKEAEMDIPQIIKDKVALYIQPNGCITTKESKTAAKVAMNKHDPTDNWCVNIDNELVSPWGDKLAELADLVVESIEHAEEYTKSFTPAINVKRPNPFLPTYNNEQAKRNNPSPHEQVHRTTSSPSQLEESFDGLNSYKGSPQPPKPY